MNRSLIDRISILRIEIPPLRERMEDFPELVSAFLYLFSTRNKKPVSHVSDEAMLQLARYSWPGNVRELERTLERAHIVRILDEVGYNKSRASEVLGIDRATLYRKAKLYRIDLKGVKGSVI